MKVMRLDKEAHIVTFALVEREAELTDTPENGTEEVTSEEV